MTPYRKSARAQTRDGHETWVAADVANTLNCFDVGDGRSTVIVVEDGFSTTEKQRKANEEGK